MKVGIWIPPRMWEGSKCWIIGGGPSMPREFGVPEDIIQRVMAGKMSPSVYSDYLTPIHGKHVMGINNAYQIGGWIDVLFFGDNSWYMVHREQLLQFDGLKVTCNPRFHNNGSGERDGVKYLARDRNHKRGISTQPGMVAWNNNSGAAAISLACHFGVKKILLLGFDMRLDKSSISHWHGRHREKNQTKPPPFRRHLRGWPAIARDAKAIGVEIVNVSPKSAVKVFPRRKLLEVI